MKTAASVLFALAAAAMFGASSVLQHAAASEETDAPMLRLGLLRRLVRRRRWIAGFALSGFSFCVQGVALLFGPLALVQPVAAADLLFAMPLMARRERLRLSSIDWLGGGLVVGGIAAFLALSPPTAGQAVPPLSDWLPALVAVAAVAGTAGPLALRSSPRVRTALLATGAAALFSLLDALTKSVVDLLGANGTDAFLHWEPYALAVVGLTGMLYAQSAFRSGSLLVSLPIIDSLEPVGAVVIGLTIFGERLASSLLLFALQVAAGALAVAGIFVLDRSPLMASLQETEAG